MPELPEVERARRKVHALCVGQTITDASVESDDIVFEKESPVNFRRHLLGATVVDVKRKGKWFWIVFNRDFQLVCHFGMTGNLLVAGETTFKYRSSPADKRSGKGGPDVSDDEYFSEEVEVTSREWPPSFCKFHFTLDNGTRIAVVDPRRLGRFVWRAGDVEKIAPLAGIARDAAYDLPSASEIAQHLSKKSAPIKAVLLDQRAVVSGLGNWMVDEILYQGKIHPAQPSNSLSAAQVSILHDKIRYVVDTALAANANDEEFPSDWLFRYRWDKAKSKNAECKTGLGESIEFVTVAGRTSAIVPARQTLDAATSDDSSKKRKKAAANTKNGAHHGDDAEDGDEDDEGEQGEESGVANKKQKSDDAEEGKKRRGRPPSKDPKPAKISTGRGRGRPKSLNPKPPKPPATRGRGRPKSAEPKEPKEVGAGPKRGRGRPKVSDGN